eukprot:SAG22_NODE_1117_length_5518_cov_6.763610_3_plen_51_part_00
MHPDSPQYNKLRDGVARLKEIYMASAVVLLYNFCEYCCSKALSVFLLRFH